MSFNPAPFVARRARLAERMIAAGGGIAIVPTAPEQARNRDSLYPYRHDSYFYYLTGFTEPEAVLVLIANASESRSLLFCREKNEEREIWDGFRFGPAAAAEAFAFDSAQTIAEFPAALNTLLAGQAALWVSLGHQAEFDRTVLDALGHIRAGARAGQQAPATMHDLRATLDAMRIRKDGDELAALRRAALISAAGHTRALRALRPGVYEYEIEAELLHEFRRHGGSGPAFPSIVASGPGACVLHYTGNDRQCQAGELLLIDAGAEYASYAGDISRTYPVSGRYEGAARDVYSLVLAAQKAAIAECKEGAAFNLPHEAAVSILAQGMLDLGLLTGSLDEVIDTGAFRRFYMHRTSHWLGLDVHDAGEYKQNGEWSPLEAGMVLTIEPGCYIRPAADVPEAFWNIGVRIEDDVLVTPVAPEVLTSAAPKCIADVEAIAAEARG